MNRFLSIVFLAFITSGLLTACKDDNKEPSAKEAFLNQVADTWTVGNNASVKHDDVDVTSGMSGFEIIIDHDLNYTIISNNVSIEVIPWPSSGSFVVNDALNQFTRDDGLIITVDVNNNNQLMLDFMYDTSFKNSHGRTEAILGHWQMQLDAL